MSLTPSLLAGPTAALTTVLVAFTVVLSIAEADFAATILVGMWLAITSVVGALICARRPENPIGRILLSGGLLIALGLFASEYALQALVESPASLPFGIAAAWLSSWVAVAGFFILAFLLILFPTGRLPSLRWRLPARAAILGAALSTTAIALRPGPIQGVRVIDNPLGLHSDADLLRVLEQISLAPVVFLGIGAIVSQFRRLRSAPVQERQQIKWFVYAAGVLVLGVGGNVLSDLVEGFPSELLGVVAPTIALLGIPIAIGIAVLKYHLYDIDIIINRTLVYGGLTATLGVAYAGGVVLLQQMFSPFTEGNQLSIAGATLAIAALFRPVRAWIQSFIDRRFYRARYDASKTLESFSARLKEEVNLDAMISDLLRVVSRTMQPAHVSLWLASQRPWERTGGRSAGSPDSYDVNKNVEPPSQLVAEATGSGRASPSPSLRRR